MPSIVKVIPHDDHFLTIVLSNRHSIICDLRPRLKTVRFRGLNDLAKFKAVRVEHGNTLVWDNLCQVTIDEILDMLGR